MKNQCLQILWNGWGPQDQFEWNAILLGRRGYHTVVWQHCCLVVRPGNCRNQPQYLRSRRPKQIARIRRTQNRFSGNTFLMFRVLLHIYLWTFFDSRGFTLLSWKKPIIHVLSEVMKRKTVNSYCFIIIVFQNAKIFTFYYGLNNIKGNVKTIWFVRACKTR